jgi:hypothetical protein
MGLFRERVCSLGSGLFFVCRQRFQQKMGRRFLSFYERKGDSYS